MRDRILVVGQNQESQNYLRTQCAQLGYPNILAAGANKALRYLRSHPVEVVLFGQKLPDMSGEAFTAQVRTRRPVLPLVMVLCDTGSKALRAALDLEIDDYLVKPFGQDELERSIQKARKLRAERLLTRRLLIEASSAPNSGRGANKPIASEKTETSTASDDARLSVGDLWLDTAQIEARRADTPLDLTPMEFQLLSHFMQYPERVLSFEELGQVLAGRKIPKKQAQSMLKRHIYNLRQKLEPDPANPRYLYSVRKHGYKLTFPPTFLPTTNQPNQKRT